MKVTLTEYRKERLLTLFEITCKHYPERIIYSYGKKLFKFVGEFSIFEVNLNEGYYIITDR